MDGCIAPMGVTMALAFHPVINSGFLVPLTAEKIVVQLCILFLNHQLASRVQSPACSLNLGPPTSSSVLPQLTGSTTSTKPLGNLHVYSEMIEAALVVNQEVVMNGLPVSARRSLG